MLCLGSQAVIGNYAVPILEDRQVWGTNDETRTAYLDTQDVARMTMAALKNSATVGRTLTLSGPQAFTTKEVIEMCENMSDGRAQVSTVPTWLLKSTRGVLKGVQWARDAADRLVSRRWQCQQWQTYIDTTYSLLDSDRTFVWSCRHCCELCCRVSYSVHVLRY